MPGHHPVIFFCSFVPAKDQTFFCSYFAENISSKSLDIWKDPLEH